MNFKKMISMLLALLMVFSLLACGGSEKAEEPAPEKAEAAAPSEEAAKPEAEAADAEGSKGTIAMLLQTLSFKRYPDGDVPYFEARVKELGYTSVVHAASDNSETQIQQAESVINQGVDCIVLQPCSDAAALTIVQMAHDAGIPVVGYNDPVDNVELDAFVGRDNVGMWKEAAELFVSVYPSGNYILCNGDEKYMAARGFQEGYSQVVYACEDINVVSDQWHTGWSAEGAMRQVEAALVANNNDIAAVVCANDPMAAGVMQALEAVDLLGTVGLVGCDLELNCAQAIVEGNMFATCFTEYGLMGEDAATLAVCLIEGTDFPENTIVYDNGYQVPYIPTKHVIVTAENMEQFIEDHPWWFSREEVYANVS